MGIHIYFLFIQASKQRLWKTEHKPIRELLAEAACESSFLHPCIIISFIRMMPKRPSIWTMEDLTMHGSLLLQWEKWLEMIRSVVHIVFLLETLGKWTNHLAFTLCLKKNYIKFRVLRNISWNAITTIVFYTVKLNRVHVSRSWHAFPSYHISSKEYRLTFPECALRIRAKHL